MINGQGKENMLTADNDNPHIQQEHTYVQMLEQELNDCITREKNYSLWMGDVLRRLPSQAGYKGLPKAIREEIEAILTGIE